VEYVDITMFNVEYAFLVLNVRCWGIDILHYCQQFILTTLCDICVLLVNHNGVKIDCCQ